MRHLKGTCAFIGVMSVGFISFSAWGQSKPQTETRHSAAALRGVHRIRFSLRLSGSTDELKRMKGIYEAADLTTSQFSQFTEDSTASIKRAGIQIVDTDKVRLENLPQVVIDMDIIDKDETGKYTYTVRIFMDEPVRLQRDSISVIRDAMTWEGPAYTERVSSSGLPEMKKHASHILAYFLTSYARENKHGEPHAK